MRCKVLLLALALVVAYGVAPRAGFAAQPFFAQDSEVVQILFKGAADNVDVQSPKDNGVGQMTIQWDVTAVGSFDSVPLRCPGRQNFETGKAYRLKLSNIPNHEGEVYYPTLSINYVTPRTRAFLEHSAIPVKFTTSDFEQVKSGNFVTKVIFLPSAQFQNLALAGGVDTIVNTQLPPGSDPIVEAQNRGAILAVVRIGNKDLSLGGMNSASVFSASPAQQLPISGVNAPAFGKPASEDVPNPTVLPTVPTPEQGFGIIEPDSPNPSNGVPAVEENWSGSKF